MLIYRKVHDLSTFLLNICQKINIFKEKRRILTKNTQIIVIALIVFDDYILIAKCKSGDYWEFPGGKLEPDENLQQALYRELDEELGLSIDNPQWLMSYPYDYPQQRIELNFFSVLAKPSDFDFLQQRGREKQPIRWVKKQNLHDYSFWPANKGILNALQLPQHYAISPSFEQLLQYGENYFAYQSQQGRKLLQLRVKSKQLDVKKYQQWISTAKKFHLSLQLNSVDVAFCNHLDEQAMKNFYQWIQNENFKLGIHLTSKELLQPDDYSYLLGLRSTSCHCLAEIQRANQLNINFALISAVKKTHSHPLQAPLGWPKFKQLCFQAQMPIYALGGMCLDDLELAKTTGAQGISGISLYLPGA